MTDTEPFIEALNETGAAYQPRRKIGISVRYLDLGGGLGISYHDEAPPHPREYADAIVRELSDLSCTLIVEPGRVIVGNAGILMTQVLYTKKTEAKSL